MSRNANLTNVPLSANRKYTVRELYQASLITSANAAVSALGNAVSGSPHQFVNRMRSTAKQLHLNSAHIVTASGITNGQAGQLKAILQFPKVMKIPCPLKMLLDYHRSF